MADQADNISAGTQIVSRVEVRGTNHSLVHPRGAVGVVTRTPAREQKHFLVRLPDGFEFSPAEARLLECPDYEAANRFLVKARREMAKGDISCC